MIDTQRSGFMTKSVFEGGELKHYDEKGKLIKCVDSYTQGVCATTPHFTRSEYLLIEESINYYTDSLNDGKGIPVVNSLAGKLLEYCKGFIVE